MAAAEKPATHNFRSSVSGRFVKPETAAKKPSQYEKERRKPR